MLIALEAALLLDAERLREQIDEMWRGTIHTHTHTGIYVPHVPMGTPATSSLLRVVNSRHQCALACHSS